MKKLFLLLLMVASITLGAAAQQTRTVSGTVTYAGDGEPLTGATVMPIGGGQGTATNIDGKFSIKVPLSVKKIRVSYVGMITQEFAVGENLDIKLDNAENRLDEVMVVAYGTAKKSAFTGSAAVVNASEIEKSQVSNALNALTGKVAGATIMNQSGQPGSGPSQIFIRGISSLNAGNNPLIVIDGAPYNGSIGDVNFLNNSDIESMTVLKDAASNALYGARGANGVILITTKKGKMGSGATVTLDAKWGLNTRATQDYNVIKDPAVYYETYYQALKNKFVSDGMTPRAAWQQANNVIIDNNEYGLIYNVFSYPSDQMFIGENGKLNPNAVYGRRVSYNGQEYTLFPDNWLDKTYQSSLRQEYSVSVNNSSENNTFYASVGYLNNEGIVANSSFERITARLSADSQVKPWLKVGGTANYTHYENNAMSGDGSSSSTVNPLAFASHVAPIYPMYIRDGNGNIMRNSDGMILYDYGDGGNAGLNRPVSSGGNGLAAAMYDTNRAEGNIINFNGYGEVRFLKDFKFTSNNSIMVDEVRATTVGNPYFGGAATDTGAGSVVKQHNRYVDYMFQQLLNWNHRFGKHDVSLLVGHENSWRKTYILGASRSGMFSPDNWELNGSVIDGSMESYTTEYNNEGYIFRAQYDYDTRYFLSASFRRDGSSRFHPDNRWGNFWSFGGAWIISKESWFKAPWVDMLKIKASYGEQGNDNIGNFRYTNTYTIVNGGGNAALTPDNVKGNPDITWEKNGNFNAGVEFAFFNNRLSGSFEGFYRKTTDMLYQKGLPVSQGYTNQWTNFGDMMNAGIEIDLSGTLVRTRDFVWNVNMNLTWLKNELTRLPEENRSDVVDGYAGHASSGYYYGEGLPIYTFYCLRYAGVNQETGRAQYWHRVTDASGNETLVAVPLTETTSNDYFLNGTALADVYGGFGTSFEFKGFDLAVNFAYQIGGQVMDTDYMSLMSSPQNMSRGQAIHADVLKSWTAENPNNSIPRWQFGDQENQVSDRFLTDASYLSLQNINFGYTLPQNIVSKMYLQKLRVYVSAENVWLWSKRQGLDPRQNISGSSSSSYYSPIRTISGGFTVTF